MNYKDYEKSIPQDFKYDGCTLAPDGSWGSCCRIHDHSRLNKDISDSDADKMLYDCMKERSNIILAIIYYVWVRVQSLTGMTPTGLLMAAIFSSILGVMFYYG